MASQAASITTSVAIYCLMAVAFQHFSDRLQVTAYYSDLPALPAPVASSPSQDNGRPLIATDNQQTAANGGQTQQTNDQQLASQIHYEYPHNNIKPMKNKRKSLARQFRYDKSHEAANLNKAECKQAMEAVKDTISEWHRLIGTLRSGLANGQIKVKATVRKNLERTLTTLQGYADGARRSLDEGNLRDANRNCRKAGFELARLAVNKEVARSEPQLEANAKRARQIYKSYRKACGGPAY